MFDNMTILDNMTTLDNMTILDTMFDNKALEYVIVLDIMFLIFVIFLYAKRELLKCCHQIGMR